MRSRRSKGGTGETTTIPGYTLDVLELSRDDNGDGVQDGILRFREVPVFVLDVADGVDGILGMNLFNTVDVLVYDPFDPSGPSVSMRFLNERLEQQTDADTQAAVDLLADAFPAFGGVIGGAGAPGLRLDNGPPWRNPRNSLDVNDDGRVTRLDALLLINDLNERGARPLPELPIRSRMRVPYPDPNGDGELTRVDILHVINYLNTHAAPEAGQMLGPAASASNSAADRPNSPAEDSLLELLSIDRRDMSGDGPVASPGAQSSGGRPAQADRLQTAGASQLALWVATDDVFATLQADPIQEDWSLQSALASVAKSERGTLDWEMRGAEPPKVGEDVTPQLELPLL